MKNILIVESNPLVAQDIEQRLQTLGYTVCAVVTTGAETIKKVAEMRPNIVLISTDLEAPLKGIEIAQDIYNRFNIPVVYLIDSINEDLKMTGDFGYVFKPYETDQLRLIIESQLYQHNEDEQIRDNAQWQSDILNKVGDAVIATDDGGFVTFMNPVAETLTGWQLEEARGEYITDVFNVSIGESDRSIGTSLMNVLHKGITLHWGLSVARDNAYLNAKSGLKIAIDYNAAPLKDNKRNITGIAVTFRDMRKHKETENRLEQTINELQNQVQLTDTIFNNISDGIVVTDEKGNFLLVNPSAERIVGMGATETIPDEWSDTYGTFYPDQVTPFPADQLPLVHAMQGRTTDAVDLFIRNAANPEGSFINVHGKPLLDPENEVKGGVIVFRDVTMIKHAEARLEQTIDELENQVQLMDIIFDNMSDGVVVSNDKGQYIMANPAAEKMIGQDFGTLNLPKASEQYGIVDPTTGALFPADQLPLARAIEGQATNNVEMRVTRGQQSKTIYLSVNGRPLLDKQGILRGGVVVARDVTALKEIEHQLEETAAELQNQVQLMDTVFNSISDGVVVTDEKGNFLLVNPEAEQIIGMGATETPPEKWADKYGIFHLDKTTPFPAEQSLMRAISGEEIDELDLFIRNSERPAGVYINVSGRALQSDTGDIRGSVIAFRDVTTLKETEIQLEQTINELQNQNRLMDTVLNSISDGVLATDTNGKYLVFSERMKQLLGVPLVRDIEIDQRPRAYGLFYPDKRTLIAGEDLPLTRAMRGEAVDDVELFVRNSELPKGIFINASGRPLQDPDGNLIGGVVLVRDVTALKAAEARLEQTVTELQNQNQLIETVFNHMSDGVIVADKQGQYVMANQTAQQMVGYTPQQPVGVNNAVELYGFFLPDEKTPFPADQLPIARALRREIADNVGLFVYNPTVMQKGIHLSISARPLYDAQGAITGSVSVARDVTEIRQAETNLQQMVKKLEEQGDLLESIFNSISDGVVVADADGDFTIFNPSAERIVGIGATETETDQWSDTYGLFFPDRVTPFPAEELPLVRAIQGETADEVEMFVRNPTVPDGVFISVNGRPLQDDKGNPKGGVIVFRDVTHRAIAEEALTQAFAQGRLEIVETILHNIGNAINSVTVGMNVLQDNLVANQLIQRFSALADMVQAHQADWSDYIKNDPKGQQVLPFMIALAKDFSEQNTQMVETIERVTERVTHIIDIIRTQRSASQTSMTRKHINLEESIQGAVKLQQDSIDKRSIDVHIDCQNAPNEIKIQESQFHQMLVNLLKNSIEAIDDLAQSDGLDEPPRITVKTYIDEGFLVIDVTDNGIGLAQKDRKLIFNAGYTTKQTGTGLGLHSIANFVIGSGGKIYPLSEGIGKGTTMRVMLRYTTIR